MTKQQVNTMSSWRFALVALLLLLLVALLLWRLLSLQVLDANRGQDFLKAQGDARTIRTELIPAYRGVITDRHGEPLAVSTPVSSLWFNPSHIDLAKDADLFMPLAKALGIPFKRLQKKIVQSANKKFVYLRRHMAPAEAKAVLDLGVKGIYAQREYKRFYPAAEVVSHLIGFTNIDGRGQEGIELAFEEWLRGEQGSKRVLKDLRGNIIRDIEQLAEASSGKDIALSIDLRLQYLAYRELKAAMQRTNAKAGSVVVLDVATGEVLAMVNQPSYNPNNRHNLNVAHMRNRAMTDVFEPGSTMKPLTMVAALESGQYQPTTKIDTSPGHIRVGSKTLLDPVNYGVIDLTKVITKSSQVGTTKVAMSLDQQAVSSVFQRFGLGVSTGSGFPGESGGMLPSRSDWRPIERANFAFGYGLSVTPLQLAQAYSIFAADGVLRPASLLKQDEKFAGEQVISSRIAQQIVDMLKTVVEDGGTGTRAQLMNYSAAGKTGTVHKVGSLGYSDDRYRALFAGLAPANNPRLATVVMIDEPRSGRYYGGEAAAPVFSKLMADALRLMNVTPDKKVTAQQSQLTRRKSV